MSNIEALDSINNSNELLIKAHNIVYDKLRLDLELDAIDVMKSSFGLAVSLTTDDKLVRAKADELIDTIPIIGPEEKKLIKEYTRIVSSNRELFGFVSRDIFGSGCKGNLLTDIRNNISLGTIESIISKTIKIIGCYNKYNEDDIFIEVSGVIDDNISIRRKINSDNDGYFVELCAGKNLVELPVCGGLITAYLQSSLMEIGV